MHKIFQWGHLFAGNNDRPNAQNGKGKGFEKLDH